MTALHPDVFSFLPVWLLNALHWLSGLVIFAEGLNKLDRTDPFRPGCSLRTRIAAWLKGIAWLLLSVGGAGALITPLVHLDPPTLQDVAVILGFAVLIVRTRIKEG